MFCERGIVALVLDLLLEPRVCYCWIIPRIAFRFPGETKPPFRSLRFLFLLFDVRIWLLKAEALFTFPLEVTRKRFLAPLLVFIFGILFHLSTGFSASGCAFSIASVFVSGDFLSFFRFRSGIRSMVMLLPSILGG